MARLIVSLLTDCLRAASTAIARRGFMSGSAAPILAAIVISRTSLVVILAFLLAVIVLFFCSHWRPMVGLRRGDSGERSGRENAQGRAVRQGRIPRGCVGACPVLAFGLEPTVRAGSLRATTLELTFRQETSP